jgi:hypothetical protein
LGSNIESKINEIGNIHLYIWLGTCNLTNKGKNFSISLANQQPEAANEIIESLQKFEAILKPYPGTKLTILEVPSYLLSDLSQPSFCKYRFWVDTVSMQVVVVFS